MKAGKKDHSAYLVDKGKANLGIFFSPFSIINPENEGNKLARLLSLGHHFKEESIIAIDEEYILFMMVIDAPLWNGTMLSVFDHGTTQVFSDVFKAGVNEVRFAPNLLGESSTSHKSKGFLTSFHSSFDKAESLAEGFSQNKVPFDFHFDLFGQKAFTAVSRKLDEKSLILSQSDFFLSQGFLNYNGHEYHVSEKNLAFLSRVDGSFPKGQRITSVTVSSFDSEGHPFVMVLSSLPAEGFSFLKGASKTFFIDDPSLFSFQKGYCAKDGTPVPPQVGVKNKYGELLFVAEGESKLEAKRLSVFNFSLLLRFGRVTGTLSLADGRTIDFSNAPSFIQETLDSKTN